MLDSCDQLKIAKYAFDVTNALAVHGNVTHLSGSEYACNFEQLMKIFRLIMHWNPDEIPKTRSIFGLTLQLWFNLNSIRLLQVILCDLNEGIGAKPFFFLYLWTFLHNFSLSYKTYEWHTMFDNHLSKPRRRRFVISL